jgi:hypothetical protein
MSLLKNRSKPRINLEERPFKDAEDLSDLSLLFSRLILLSNLSSSFSTKKGSEVIHGSLALLKRSTSIYLKTFFSIFEVLGQGLVGNRGSPGFLGSSFGGKILRGKKSVGG